MKYQLPLLVLCLLSLVVLPLLAQDSTNPPPAPVTTQAPAQPPVIENPPPPSVQQLERPNFNPEATPTRSTSEYIISLGVLAFGLGVIIALMWVIMRRMEIKETSDLVDALKLPVVVVIVITSVFLVTAGYGNQQIAPIIGLMGTIAGYLMGRNGK